MIQLYCPWCGGAVAVDPAALGEPIRCDGCATDLSFAPETAPLAVAETHSLAEAA